MSNNYILINNLTKMEKATVTFKHEDGRTIACNIKMQDNGEMNIGIDFGKNGASKDDKGLHIMLFSIFMDLLKKSE